MKKSFFSIGKTRSTLYKTTKFLGDVNAIKRGKIGQRLTNRAVGKISGNLSGKITRGILGIFK